MSGKRNYEDEDTLDPSKRHQMVDTLLREASSKENDADAEASVYDDLLQDPEEVEKENAKNESAQADKNQMKGVSGHEDGGHEGSGEGMDVDVDPSVTAVARAAQNAGQGRGLRGHGSRDLEEDADVGESKAQVKGDDHEEDEDEDMDDENVDIDDVDKDPDAVIDEDDDEDGEHAGSRRAGRKNGAAGQGAKKEGDSEGAENDSENGSAAPRRGRKPGLETGSSAWKQQRKESHKEVERRRRMNINTAIEKLSDLLPVKETSKAAILSRAAEYIQKMKETETANIEKWTLQKLLGEQQVSSLSSSVEKLEQELSKAYKNQELLKKKLKEAGIDDPTEA